MKEFSHPSEAKVAVDLNRAIETTMLVAQNELKHVADTRLDLDAQLPLVPCLPGEFNQVVLNLLINAAHAIADMRGQRPGTKGVITVSTRRVDDWAEVRIEDTGGGIPESARSGSSSRSSPPSRSDAAPARGSPSRTPWWSRSITATSGSTPRPDEARHSSSGSR